jgi:alkylation response protein AidB-like acyl-CoA dehydrogenase
MTDLLYGDVEEQLRASVRDVLEQRARPADTLRRSESGQPYDPALWRTLAVDVGLAGLAVKEEHGGHGASWREVAVVAEELGASVAPAPFLSSVVLAPIVAETASAHDLLRRLATGESSATVAATLARVPGGQPTGTVVVRDGALHGTVRGVLDTPLADTLLVVATDGDEPVLAEVAASDADIATVPSLDMTRPLADVTFTGAAFRPLATGQLADVSLRRAFGIGAAILASEQVGLAQRCLDMTVSYLQERYQFGRQIGSYQALKHRVADVWAALTQARATARYAADCMARADPDSAVAISIAKAFCSPVAVSAAEECVQLHGGIGFTWEHPAHLYLKRAKADAVLLGSAADHRNRLAGLVDLPRE